MNQITRNFIPRSKFVFDGKVNWYPGHMHKGIKDIGRALKRTDCILEIHDSRIAFSGRNLNLISRISMNKPIILIMNKVDLIEPNLKPLIKSKLHQQMKDANIQIENIFFMDSIAASGRKGGYNDKFLDALIKSIAKFQSNDTNLISDDSSYNLLVMGIPNVGKSTVINRLRNIYLNKPGKATKIGPTAGVTRAVLEKIKICDHPRKLYLYDSPGILEPSFKTKDDNENYDAFFKCAAVGCMSDKVIGNELIADYILYWLNKNEKYQYMDYFGLTSPSDNISEVLAHGAIKYEMFNQTKTFEGKLKLVPNLEAVAEKFLASFRKGSLGKFFLDSDYLDTS